MSDGYRLPLDIPVIHTERLTLCGHQLADFTHSQEMWGDPEVTRYIGGQPLTREQVWTIVLRYVGHWAMMGFGYWAVRDRATDRFLGEVGFADGKRNIEPPLDGIPEIGWVLVPDAQGRGLATEAVRAALTWLEDHRGARRTVCLIDPENAASIRVAEKCGYERMLETTYKDEPTLLFGRDAPGAK